jgi:hypothetical protein
MSVTFAQFDEILACSAATAEFRQAVRDYRAGRATPLISAHAGAPPIKVLRVVAKLLEEVPDLAVDRVEVEGHSGCSDFTGSVRVNGGEREYAFTWDCRWRAQQEGWVDAFGYPDQLRAAQSFGHQCFERFEQTR